MTCELPTDLGTSCTTHHVTHMLVLMVLAVLVASSLLVLSSRWAFISESLKVVSLIALA